MRKAELLALLAQYPDDMEVFVCGYESGYDHATDVHVTRLEKVRIGDKWSGDYEQDDRGKESIVIK